MRPNLFKTILPATACVVALLQVTAVSAERQRDRHIDRPLQGGHGTGNVGIGIGISLADSAVRVSSPGVSYSVNDRIAFSNLPWPAMQFLLVRRDSSRTSVLARRMDLAVRVGVTSSLPTSYIATRDDQQREEICLFPQAALLGKLRFGRHTWSEWILSANTVNVEAVDVGLASSVGVQFTSRLYGKIGYHGALVHFFKEPPMREKVYLTRYASSVGFYRSSTAVENRTRVAHTMPITFGVDLGTHVTAEGSVSIGRSVRSSMPGALTLSFHW